MSTSALLPIPTSSVTDSNQSPQVASQYRHWRKRVLYSVFIGYACYYFCRVNIGMALPFLQKDLHFDKVQLGLIVSALQITYGIGKFINGIIADRTNPRYVMALGLLLSAVANIVFSFNTMLWVLVVTWACNGWFQSMGYPAGVRLLSHWYSPKEYGKSWGVFGCSHQVGAAIIFIAGGYLVLLGWQYAFIIPSIIAFLVAIFLFDRIRDIPENMGLPSIEAYTGDTVFNVNHSGKKARFFNEALFKNVLANRFIWYTALGNMFLYFVRYGLMTWTPLFLNANKGVTVSNSGWVLAVYELVGMGGMLVAGYLSDRYAQIGRGPVMTLFMLLLSVCVGLFWLVPYGNMALILLILALCGFLLYGPQMLVGVASATFAGKQSAATASGFAGFWGYVGATVSGIGIGATAEYFGWKGAFVLIVLCSLMSALFFALTWGYTRKVKTSES
ncbi:MAG: MFS transporter [Bacteroidota bacterium]